jgi:4'-phosphopantetheinyl transferase
MLPLSESVPIDVWSQLSPGTVHLWQMQIATVKGELIQWQGWLSADETARADRFRRDLDRRQFILSRGGLRYLLGRYLNRDPATLTFDYGEYGKPCLPLTPEMTPTTLAPLYFNLAHSEGWVVYGFSRDRPIGVDVEQIQPRAYLEGLIQRCLTPAEQSTLPTDAGDRLRVFMQYWTLKEAHLKAIGQGLSYGMNQVEILWGQPPCLGRPAKLPNQDPLPWHMRTWYPDERMVAAVCGVFQAGAIELYSLPSREHS